MLDRVYIWLRAGAAAAVCVGTTLGVVAASLPLWRSAASMTVERTGAGEAAVVRAIDEAMATAWSDAELDPLERADDRTVVRRLSLALSGTVPSLEELRALEAIPEERRIDAHLDHLLEDRRFSDYWAERWARAYVGTESGPLIVYRRRRLLDWLSDELAANTPYDELVRKLVSSEGLWTDKPETNFITAHERDAKKLAATTARAFLGVRLDCAECHDHPFAHWKQADFEGLAGFYADLDQGLFGITDGSAPLSLEDPSGEMRTVEARVPFADELLPAEGRARTRLAGWLTHPDNPYLARATAHRVWTLMFGQGFTHAVDDIEPEPVVPAVLDLLADDFRDHGFDLQRLIRVIAATRAFRLQAAGPGDQAGRASLKFAAFPATPLRGEQIAGALAQVSSLRTLDAGSHLVWRLMRSGTEREFVARYGDRGRDELSPAQGSIAQRLTLMNGKVAAERVEANLFSAAGRIAGLAPDDQERVRLCFLVVLTRVPTAEELERFAPRFATTTGRERQALTEDLLWTLINTTEFSWNH
jgi:hypothetical protein